MSEGIIGFNHPKHYDIRNKKPEWFRIRNLLPGVSLYRIPWIRLWEDHVVV